MKTETSMKHTPGPWTNTPMQDTIWANDGEIKIAKIADLPWIDHKSQWEQEEANARLIAAAPELLEACRAVMEDPYTTCACAEKVRAAIAKAEGK